MRVEDYYDVANKVALANEALRRATGDKTARVTNAVRLKSVSTVIKLAESLGCAIARTDGLCCVDVGGIYFFARNDNDLREV